MQSLYLELQKRIKITINKNISIYQRICSDLKFTGNSQRASSMIIVVVMFPFLLQLCDYITIRFLEACLKKSQGLLAPLVPIFLVICEKSETRKIHHLNAFNRKGGKFPEIDAI